MTRSSLLFHRPVSANERLYLVSEGHFSHLVIQAVIEGRGHLDPETLQNALIAVCDSVPGSRLRLVGSRWVADGRPPQLIVLPHYPDVRGRCNESVHLHGRFRPERGETTEVALAHDGERCLLIFRALHAVMDGQGMQLWMKAVFQQLRGDTLLRGDSPLTDDALLKKTAAPIRSDEPIRPTAAGPQIPSQRLGEAFAFDYACETLSGPIPGIIAKLGVGLQKLLMPMDQAQGKIMVPVDLRQDQPHMHPISTANLSLPLFLPLRYQEPWGTLSQRLLDLLQKKRYLARGRNDALYRNLPSKLISFSYRQLWLKQLKEGRYLLSAVISHTGRQNLQDFSSAAFQAESIAFFPCPIPIAPLSLIITEYGSRTEICLVKARPLWDAPEQLLQRLLKLADLPVESLRDRTHRSTKGSFPRHSRPPTWDPVLYPDAHLLLHQLVERQVMRTPEATALIFADRDISYRSLNAQANQLARLLRARGLENGDFVGVGLERSPAVIISILAIMKAGGVYVPLDPSMPASRLTYMLNDSAARFVLVLAQDRALYASETEVLALDEFQTACEAQSDENLDLPIKGSDLCYMIYTSGSTGQPKGALNQHAGVSNHFLWMQKAYGLGTGDCTLQKTPISFDASLLEIFLPLQSGCRIVIAKPDGHKDTRYMLSEILRHRVTFMSFVPSVFNLFLDEIDRQNDASLRLVLLGGEEFTAGLYEKFRQRFPTAAIHNLYGPAEAAIDVTTFDCSEGFSGRSVPIGRPIANIECYVVDEELRHLSPGEVGELLIAGIGLGPGYLKRPELTDEKYIPHPFRPDAKAYRTGDRVRLLPDGNLEFLGRLDHQVKIRGVRIEIGEIEHSLSALPFVNQAVVIARDIQGQTTLIAYYTDYPDSDAQAQAQPQASIREHLRRSLPDYMLPAAFIRLDRMPFNPNGKVDRKALPEPEPQAAPDEIFQAESATEELLANIWIQLLKVQPYRQANFFEQGGHSLHAISLVSRLNELLGTHLHAQDLIEQARFDLFAQHVAAAAKQAPRS